MPGETPLARLKVDIWMPLDIGKFLQDTIHLNAQQIGSYLLLLMRYWGEGALPNDPEELATTARVSADTWSKTQVVLSRYFKTGEDGLLHQSGADRRRAAWIDKRLKAREKAIKAITARWSKHKAKLASQANTPSKPEVLLENYPSPEVQVQKQKQPTPTPPAARQGMKPNGVLLQAPSTQPPGPGRSAGARSPIAEPAGTSAAKHKRNKGERAANGPAAGRQETSAGVHRKITNGALVSPQPTVAPGAQKAHSPVRPQKVDPREAAFQREIFAYWKGLNPEHPKCPWSDHDLNALRALLIRVPDLSFEEFKRLLKNRAASHINPSAHPFKWLRGLLEYSAGPLASYGKPARPARVM